MELIKKALLSPEQKALRFSVFLEVLSALWALVMALYTQSMAIAMDVAYSFLSAFLSFLGVFSVRLIDRGATKRHPMGFYAYEVFISFIRSLMLMGMIVIMFGQALGAILSGGRSPMLGAIIVYTIPSLGAAILGYGYSSYTLKHSPSMTLEADVNEWRSDVLISLVTLVVVLFAYFLKNTPLSWTARYADPAVVIVLCLMLIGDPIKLLSDSFKHLMLQSVEPEFSRPFRKSLSAFVQQKAPQFELGFVDVVSIGRMVWVMVEIIPRDEKLPLETYINLESSIEAIAKNHFPHVDISLYFGGCTRNES